MSKVSFEGIGEVAATFWAEGEVQAGQVVKVSGNAAVKACADGEKFCGVALGSPKGGCVAVQTGGFAQVKCADSAVTVGYVGLAADGQGGVKKAEGGKEYLVVADDGAGIITIQM